MYAEDYIQAQITEQAWEACASLWKLWKGPKNKQNRAPQIAYLVSFHFDANIMPNFSSI